MINLAIILIHQGDFHVVEYLGWETTYTEIVPSDRSEMILIFVINIVIFAG